MSQTLALEILEASKWFGHFQAVKALSMQVPQGSIVGFLGPNGAGKSTSLRLALGILSPESGAVRLFGEKPNLTSLRRVGFLPEERGLYKKMTPHKVITYFARLKGLTARRARQRADELLEQLGLEGFAHQKVTRLSKGMAQKVQILSAIAHEPDFLLLDEPFSGLDPVNQQALEDLIIAEHKRGATIIFSTHVMEHAERLCEHIVMMARGRKVFDGTLEQAYSALGQAVFIGVSDQFDLAEALAETDFSAHKDGDQWRVGLPASAKAQDALQLALLKGAPIQSFVPQEARLRDVFVSVVTEAEAQDLEDQPGQTHTEPDS